MFCGIELHRKKIFKQYCGKNYRGSEGWSVTKPQEIKLLATMLHFCTKPKVKRQGMTNSGRNGSEANSNKIIVILSRSNDGKHKKNISLETTWKKRRSRPRKTVQRDVNEVTETI